MFAKEFEWKGGQIVVFRPSEDEAPALYFWYEVNGIVTSVRFKWKDNKFGWRERDKVWEAVDEEIAIDAIQSSFEEISGYVEMIK